MFSASVPIVSDKKMSLMDRMRRKEWKELPPPKRQNVGGRAHVRAVSGMMKDKNDELFSLAIVRCVIKYTGMESKPGGGEKGIPMRITSYVTGWAPILNNMIQEDLVTSKMMRLMARFACKPSRLMVERGRVWMTTARCSKRNVGCPFRWTSSEGCECCQVTHVDWMGKQRMRQTILEVGLGRYDAPIPGDEVPFAERIVQDYVAPKQAKFAANDAAKAERKQRGMPTASEWKGVQFQIRAEAGFPTYTVKGTRTTQAGRVKELCVCDARDTEEAGLFWVRLRPQGRGWNLYVPRNLPREIRVAPTGRWLSPIWGRDNDVRIEAFESLLVHYAGMY